MLKMPLMKLKIKTFISKLNKLQKAADISDETITHFALNAALEKAERVLAIDSPIGLTQRESMRMLELIENPQPRNEKFLQAMARYQEMRSHTTAQE